MIFKAAVFSRNGPQATALAIVIVLFGGSLVAKQALGAQGHLEVAIIDADTKAPLAARLLINDQRGRNILLKGEVSVGRNIYVDGSGLLALRKGTYRISIDHGPEYRGHVGHFKISGGDQDHTTVELDRYVDMSRLGWWSGDLQCHQTASRMPLLMDAENLQTTAVFAKRAPPGKLSVSDAPPTDQSRPLVELPCALSTVIDWRSGAPLLVVRSGSYNSSDPPPERTVDWLTPEWNDEESVCVGGHPTAWQLPLWIASQRLDGLLVMSPEKNAERDCYVPKSEPTAARWGAPMDRRKKGRWNEFVYHQMLDCGLRVTPLAASGSGLEPVAPGSQRVYAFLRGEETFGEWWKALKRGRVMLSNGPLIIAMVNGKPPGYVFTGEPGQEVDLEIALTLHTKQNVEYLEVIKNGRVEHTVRLDAWAKANGKLPKTQFTESGWLLVRAVTDERDYYQFAMTGAYFVKIGGKPRISRSAVEFFSAWLRESFSRNQEPGMSAYYRSADRYWRSRLAAANAE